MIRYDYAITMTQKGDDTIINHDFKFYKEKLRFYLNGKSEESKNADFVLIDKLKKEIIIASTMEKMDEIKVNIIFEKNKLKYLITHKKNKIIALLDGDELYSLSGKDLVVKYNCSSCGKECLKKRTHFVNFLKHKDMKDDCSEKILKDRILGDKMQCFNCNSSDSHKTKEYLEKYKKTSLETFGVEHPMKSHKIKKKNKEYFLKTLGATSPFSSKECREKIHKTKLKKYGKMSTTNPNKNIRRVSSKLEVLIVDKIKNKLKELGYKNLTFYDYSNKQWFLADDRRVASVDFYIKEIKYAMEVDGDFWHGNLDVFDGERKHPYFGVSFKELNKQSNLKKEWIRCQKSIDKLESVWENDIINDEQKIVDDIIKNIIKIIKEKENE